MYLYIDQATSKIAKYSPVPPKDRRYVAAIVPPELEIQLQRGDTSSLKNYFVMMHADGRLTVERKEEAVTWMNKRLASTELVEVLLQKDADLDIIIDNKNMAIKFRLNRIFNINAETFVGTSMTSKMDRCIMYFTKKNDPSYLLFFIDVPLEELLKAPANILAYPLPVSCLTASVYTRPILNSYSLEILNAG